MTTRDDERKFFSAKLLEKTGTFCNLEKGWLVDVCKPTYDAVRKGRFPRNTMVTFGFKILDDKGATSHECYDEITTAFLKAYFSGTLLPDWQGMMIIK